jgi:hemerythrin
MAIVWTDGLSVGVKVIDQQHQEMIKRINRLLDAMQGGKGGKEAEGAIEFLEEYVVVHFGAEEELMKKHTYPALQSHLVEHDYFRKEVARLRTQVNEGADLNLLFNTTRKLLVAWFLHHIDSVDRSLGRYLKTRGDLE